MMFVRRVMLLLKRTKEGKRVAVKSLCSSMPRLVSTFMYCLGGIRMVRGAWMDSPG
jgi:hypothetical protein